MPRINSWGDLLPTGKGVRFIRFVSISSKEDRVMKNEKWKKVSKNFVLKAKQN